MRILDLADVLVVRAVEAHAGHLLGGEVVHHDGLVALALVHGRAEHHALAVHAGGGGVDGLLLDDDEVAFLGDLGLIGGDDFGVGRDGDGRGGHVGGLGLDGDLLDLGALGDDDGLVTGLHRHVDGRGGAHDLGGAFEHGAAGVHDEEHVGRVVVLDDGLQGGPLHRDMALADAEEAADVEDHGLQGAVDADDEIADLADVVPFGRGAGGHGGRDVELLLDGVDPRAHQVGGGVVDAVLDGQGDERALMGVGEGGAGHQGGRGGGGQ